MPILDKIKLELNSKINEWINVRNIINRYLQTVEHQVKWKKRYKSKLMLSCFMILAWYATICSNWITIRLFFSPFLPQSYSTIRARRSLIMIVTEDVLTWFNWIVFMAFVYLFIYFIWVLRSSWITLRVEFFGFFLVLFLILQF